MDDAGGLSAPAARFAADFAAIWPEATPVGLAVSGGPDSLALLLLADEALRGRFEVATVDHRLRAAGADEAAMVAALCAERAIPHRVLAVEVPTRGNLQANARNVRYAALAAWAKERGLAAVAAAHHLDDQAETLLMRLVRGAGVRGLAGMRRRALLPGGGGVLLRPLLSWRRAELAELVAGAGLRPADDPGNADLRFERATMRRRLAGAPWLRPEALAVSASHLADADEVIEWAVEREFESQVTLGCDLCDYRPRGPRALRLRMLERLVWNRSLMRRTPPRGSEYARLLDRLEAGQTSTLDGTRCEVLADGRWRFTAARPRRG